MKKWITGAAIACTILSTTALAAQAKPIFNLSKLCQLIPICGQPITPPSLPGPSTKPEANKPAPEVTPESKPETNAPIVQDSTYAKQVLDLVNMERSKKGLSPLTLDASLNAVALAHSGRHFLLSRRRKHCSRTENARAGGEKLDEFRGSP